MRGQEIEKSTADKNERNSENAQSLRKLKLKNLGVQRTFIKTDITKRANANKLLENTKKHA